LTDLDTFEANAAKQSFKISSEAERD